MDQRLSICSRHVQSRWMPVVAFVMGLFNMPDKPPFPETIAAKLDRLGLLVKNSRGRGRFYDWLMEQDLADHLSRPTKRAVEQGFAEVWRVIPNVASYMVVVIKTILPENPFISAWEDYKGSYLSVTGIRENLADSADLERVLAALRANDWIGPDGRPTEDALATGGAKMGNEEILGWLDEGLGKLLGEFEVGRRTKA